MDYSTKEAGSLPALPVERPTEPGRPWAVSPPEGLPPEGGGGTSGSVPLIPTEPGTPIAPPPAEPPELPTDPINPADPTVPVALTTEDPVLELPPEGMLRISKSGKEDQFVFPVHADRWADDGWKVHAPVSIKEDGGGDPGSGGGPGGGGSPYPSGSPTITSIASVPIEGKASYQYTVGAGPVPSVVIGTGFEPGSQLSAATPYGFCLKDVQDVDPTKMHFTFDASMISAPVDIPIWASNSFGAGDFYLLSVVAGSGGGTPGLPTITSIEPTPGKANFEYGCSEPPLPSVVAGTGFASNSQLWTTALYQSAMTDVVFVDPTTITFTFDATNIELPCDVPFWVKNGVSGTPGPQYLLPVVAWDKAAGEAQTLPGEPEPEPAPEGLAPEEPVDLPAEPVSSEVAPPDYDSMTKAQIVASCEKDFGVTLDDSQTKAVLMQEANRLWEESVTAPAEQPVTAEPDTSIPTDLLG